MVGGDATWRCDKEESNEEGVRKFSRSLSCRN